MNQIFKGFLKGLGSIGEETGKELVTEPGRMVESIITGKELLGNIASMSDRQLHEKKSEEDKKKEEELARLRRQMGPGRNVEAEIKEVRDEKAEAEKQKEEEFLRNLQIQRQREKEEYEAMCGQMGMSDNPAKRKKSRGSAFAKGKQGKASTSDMSATAEFYKKPD